MSMPTIECNNIDKCCAASSLLQSIALEETAISHILNAEGEKLQKAVSIACEQKDLIEINNSVESMVDKITGLEIVLKSKLDLIKPILDDCKDCRKDNCKDSYKDYGKDDCKNYGRDDKCDKKPHKSEY